MGKMDYLHNAKKIFKWLVPFVLAIFLLFGCGEADQYHSERRDGRTETEESFSHGAETVSESSDQLNSDITPGQDYRPRTDRNSGSDFSPQSGTVGQEGGSSRTEEPSGEMGAGFGQVTGDEIDESGSYTDKEHVALYLHTYGHLPDNFITKQEAQAAGWNSKKGNLWEAAPGKSIGGDRFGNYEKKLPAREGRTWFECDINFDGTYRGAERILYSSDGLIYYTEDHYQTFEQLY